MELTEQIKAVERALGLLLDAVPSDYFKRTPWGPREAEAEWTYAITSVKEIRDKLVVAAVNSDLYILKADCDARP